MGRPGRGPRRPQPGYDDGWARPSGMRVRSAVHDPWRERRRIGFPGGMPNPPLLLGGVMVVLFAFLLGRCTAGGGDEVATDTVSSTIATVLTTTTLFNILHTVQANESLAIIASKYNVTIDQIAIANNIGNANNIFVGQQLKIPPPTPVTTIPVTTTKAKKK